MKAFRAIRLAAAAATAIFATFSFASLLAEGQDVRIVSINGLTRVNWQGKEVFAGATTGPVTSHSVSTNGAHCAAVFSGDKVLWESAPGAAALVKASVGPMTNQPGLWPSFPALPGGPTPVLRSGADGSSLSVTTTNGFTTVSYKGQTVFQGPTQGGVTARSKNVNSEESAAAFDGDQVLWENALGAAEQVK